MLYGSSVHLSPTGGMKYAPSVAMPGQVYTTTEGNPALVVSGMTSSHDLHLRNLWFLAIANLAILFLHHRALLPCQWRECCSSCVMVPGFQVLQPGAVTCLWDHTGFMGKLNQQLCGCSVLGVGTRHRAAAAAELGPAQLAWYVPEEQGR